MKIRRRIVKVLIVTVACAVTAYFFTDHSAEELAHLKRAPVEMARKIPSQPTGSAHEKNQKIPDDRERISQRARDRMKVAERRLLALEKRLAAAGFYDYEENPHFLSKDRKDLQRFLLEKERLRQIIVRMKLKQLDEVGRQ